MNEINGRKTEKIENWFKEILERARADAIEVREVLAAFSGLSPDVVRVIIISGLNCLSFFERRQIEFLIAFMENARHSLLAEKNGESYRRLYESHVGYFLAHSKECPDVIGAIKKRLLSFPTDDHEKTACLFFFLEKCLQFSLKVLRGELSQEAIEEAVDTGTTLL